ncbi:MAG: membrane protein insertase YidC [Candidatus Rokubacteria bacterium]|nr:membrane protein insertase YidC [Candidatus Rokubacteria bacterium]
MEKRAILAAVLMAGLLIIYQTFFFPAQETPPKQEAPAQGARPAAAPPAPVPARALTAQLPAPAPPEAAPVSRREAPRPPQRIVPVESPLYRAAVSSEGGKLQEWTLRYRGEKPMVVVGELGPAGLMMSVDPSRPGDVVPFDIQGQGLRLDAKQQPAGEIPMTGEEAGLRVRQVLRFDANQFAVEALIRLDNPTAASRKVTVSLPWISRAPSKGEPERFGGQHPTEVVWSTKGHIDRIDDRAKVSRHTMEGEWVGLDSTWYLVALIPKTPGFTLLAASLEAKPGEAKNGAPAPVSIAVTATPTIAPGQSWEGRVVMYIGPKEYDRLVAYDLQGTLNFGGFPIPRKYGGLPMEWIGVPILRLMNWVYRHVGNYGIAIVLLTVVSKILFYPLTVKSMRSMKAMQTLQPQINALRSKYKSDPQRLQRETLELYRKHKVNPMGGCLPMVAQIPIFYALYLALSVSVELQNAPLLCFGRAFGMDLWICDLASQDPTYILPILMGVTMFVQQKMSPSMGDPRQAKMMLVMPFVFTFMFLNLPAGLVLYWTVSNVLQILQQWSMDRPARNAAREAKDAARA